MVYLKITNFLFGYRHDLPHPLSCLVHFLKNIVLPFQVLEETGFDISSLINPNDYIESLIHEQTVRLYIIGGIQRDTKFEPKTRNEIKAVEWFPIADLPNSRKDLTPKVKMGVGANSFFMVVPFIK